MGDSLADKKIPRWERYSPMYCLVLVVGTFIICAIRLVGFVQDCAVNVLFDDQWDYLNPLFKREGPLAAFFYQHGPPRMGLGNLIDWYLYDATGWDVRAVAWAAVLVLLATTLTAIFLMVRLRGRLSWVDAGVPLLLLSPIHWESMILTPSLAPMILPLFLIFLVALAWSSDRSWVRVLGVGIFGVLDLFTGYGLCSIPVTTGLAAILLLGSFRRQSTGKTRKWEPLLILMILGAGLLAFAPNYQWAPAVPGWRFPVSNWWDYPRFCALMFTNLLGIRMITWASGLAGATLLILVSVAFSQATTKIWQGDVTSRTKVVWTLTGVSLVYSVLTAIGRLPVNIEAAFMWRYVTLMTPAIFGLAIALEGWTSSQSGARGRLLMAGWVLLAGFIWCNFRPERNGAALAKAKKDWIASYLKTGDLKEANKASGFWVYFPDPDSSRIAERLHWLKARNLSFFRESQP